MNRALRQMLAVALAAAILAALLWWADPARVLDAVRTVTLPALLLASGLYAVAWLFRSARWRALLGDALPMRRAFGLTVAGNAANVVLPAKLGDALRAVAAARLSKTPIERALAAGVADRVFDLSAVAALTLVAVALHPIALSRGFLLPAGLVLVAAAGAVGAGLWYARARRGSGRLAVVERFLAALAQTAADAGRRPARTLALGAASLVVWTLEATIAFTLARALGLDLAFGAVLLAVMLANMAKAVPLTPSGLGTYEVAFSQVLVVSGVDPVLATAAAFLDHGLKNALTLAAGGVSWLLLGPSRVPEAAATSPQP